MKKMLIVAFFCVTSNFLISQENTVATGGQAIGAGGTVSYSVGQVDYIGMEGLGGNANQGVQQPYEFFIVISTNGLEEAVLTGRVYPVPTSSDVNLKLENVDLTNLSYSLFSINGQELLTEGIYSENTVVPLDIFPEGTYLLKLQNESIILKEFKIIKH